MNAYSRTFARRVGSTLPLLLLLAAAPAPRAIAQSATPPNLPMPPRAAATPRAKPPAKGASTAASAAKAEPEDVPKADAATCTGPACAPAAPAPMAAAKERQSPRLNAAATRSVAESQSFANHPAVTPVLGKGGRVMFTYGDSVPTVVCAPLRVCDVELEAGENIQGSPHIGDAVRWRISPAVSYEGEQRITHLVIKATAADLDTNLIVPTDRRTYYLRLVSNEDKYISRVAFDYPDNDARAWRKVSQGAKSGGAASASAQAAATDDLPAVALGRLRFNYAVTTSGSPRFKPVRVMDDGTRTFITMNEGMTVEEAPVLFVVGADGQEQLVNYRLRGNIFVIDRLADKFALVSGTGGAQQRVDITRDTCVKRGWFSTCANAAGTANTSD
jgi:type IV secretion system protein VirB9